MAEDSATARNGSKQTNLRTQNSLEEASGAPQKLSALPNLGHGAHVFRARAATAPNPLRAGATPTPCQFAKGLDLSVTLPAAIDRIPLLAGIGVDDDRLARGLSQLANKAADQLGSSAI